MDYLYSRNAEAALELARKAADEGGRGYVGTEHLLLGLLLEKEGTASAILQKNGVTEEKIREMMQSLRMEQGPTQTIDKEGYSPRLSLILERAAEQARRLESKEIGTEHLLLGMILERGCVALKLMEASGANVMKVYLETIGSLGFDPANFRDDLAGYGNGAGWGSQGGEAQKGKGILEQFSKDLTEAARIGKLDPVIGREDEMQRVIQILSRRTKNNPCLIGEPGVGKTAIVEGLAQRIAQGQVPDSLIGKHLVTLDLSGMVAGTKYRGEFEERIKGVIEEVSSRNDVILFVDEVHTLVGAGGAEGAMDASNILKPALSRGELQMIGATTTNEYRKRIEKDAALERRFQPVEVEAPSVPEAVKILEGIAPLYEKHHGLRISPEAIRAAVELSERYINDRNLPDKAIDVLDEAAAAKRLKGSAGTKEANELEKAASELTRLDALVADCVEKGDLAGAKKARADFAKMKAEYDRLSERRPEDPQYSAEVGEEDVARVISLWAKIPLEKLDVSESRRLASLEDELHKRVIGQKDAVTAVAKAVRRGRVGLQDPNRPIGSFLFLGPTGVGKTELSKALAEAVFGDDKSLIRVDMSEYMEQYAVSKIIGSAPGYVGYDEGGQLSEKVRRHPYSVVLFDEIEKAHPDVFNVLLQILDEGRLTDSQGRTVNFKNTIIIMTSNVGARNIVENKTLGFAPKPTKAESYEKMQSGVMEEVKKTFRPEFINRIDGIEVFHALDKEEMLAITGLLLKDLAKRAREQKQIEVRFTPSLKQYLVDRFSDEKMGARPLKRAVQTNIEDDLAWKILSGEISEGDAVTVGYAKEKVTFAVKPGAAAAKAASKKKK